MSKALPPSFPCVVCARKFSSVDVDALRYLLPSQVCFDCYKSGKVSKCFGHFNVTEDACTRFCPDRAVCREWPQLVQVEPEQAAAVFAAASSRITAKKLDQATKRGRQRAAKSPFRDNTIIGAFFRTASSSTGLPLKHLETVCAQIESPVKDYYRKLYAGYSGGWTWKARLENDTKGNSVLFITECQQVLKGRKSK